jgi:formylglycine-generating enzyme required for sulfatase activity
MNRPLVAGVAALAMGGLVLAPGPAADSKPDAGAPPKNITNSIGLKLTLIPAGKFQMVSPATEKDRGENELQHPVTISKPFYMGIYEVTQHEFHQVIAPKGDARAHFDKAHGGGPDHPMENLRWAFAVEFCEQLSGRAEEKRAGRRYRLPTEAEWEYACRAGTTTPFHVGEALSSKDANFNGNFPYGGADKGPYLRKTAKVGSYPPNAWGLYDMHGNVWEWCSDWYDPDYYSKSPRQDPAGPLEGVLATGYSGAGRGPGPGDFYRVCRGGSWLDEARGCRSAYRFRAMPSDPYRQIGFRVVCDVSAKAP